MPLGTPIQTAGEIVELDVSNHEKQIRTVEVRFAASQWEGQPAYIASLRDVTERKRMEEALRDSYAEEQRHRAELAALYDLSRSLAETDDLNAILERVVRDTVQILHITFARLALLEGEALVIRAAYPIRVLERDLQVGQKESLEKHPFCQQTLAENIPIVLPADDTRLSAVERGCFLLDVAQSVCLVPLCTGNTALGLLLLGEERRVEREPFNADKVRMARSIGDQAGGAIQRALLHAQTEKLLQQLEAIHQIDRTISSSTDLRPTLSILVDQAARQLRADAVDILLYDPATLSLEYAAGQGFRTGGMARSRLRLGEGYEIGRASCRERVS
jgi:transcriptional regulator with GAF, ATPase, and Fis domain